MDTHQSDWKKFILQQPCTPEADFVATITTQEDVAESSFLADVQTGLLDVDTTVVA